MTQRRTAIALLVVAVLVVFGTAACSSKAQPATAQPAAVVPSAASGEPSLPPESSTPSTSSLAPSVRASRTAGPSGTPKASAESAFAVRPPGAGSGPAGSRAHTGSTAVALTFDDGPDPVNTPKILEVLRANGVKATFCLVGFRVRDHPELVRQIVAGGHTLCNHSWQHLTDLAQRDQTYVDWDLQHTNEMIHAAVGNDVPIKYFRAPGGNFTADLVAKAQSMGMAPIYWDVDPQDWNHKNDASDAAHIARVIGEVKRQVRQGSIILSHDNVQPDTIVAYQTLVPFLKRYFTLVALPT
ncbi:polysaccharide deacetylase family protein [Dactylosporangium sp. McL0621]|uniref:polysaccharide deacetylase family protein n=1 Tax=Dactylosporangium sp. McL0621 TaxID=3415678 RepID=UPI003CFBA110